MWSATANDLASARPPKYFLTISTVSGWPSKSLASWLAAAESARRSWPTAWIRKSAASGSMRTWRARSSLTTKPGNSRAVSGADFTSVTLAELAQLGQQAAALGAAAVGQHQRDVLGRRGGVVEQAGRRLLGQVLQAAYDDAAGRGEQRRRGQVAELGHRQRAGHGLGELGLGVVAPHRRAHRRDGALTEELLRTGHQGEPAEHVLWLGLAMAAPSHGPTSGQ